MRLLSSTISTEKREDSSVGASQTSSTGRWNLKESNRIETLAQPYCLSEDEKQIEFLFKAIGDKIAVNDSDHNLAMQFLHHVARECWLDAQDEEAIYAGYALSAYVMQTLAQPALQAENGAAGHSPEMTQLRQDIERLAVPEDEEDAEAFPPASHDSITRALDFIERMHSSAYSQGETPRLPSVFATRDGGVQLFWKIDRRQTLLIFRPGKQTVEVGLKQPDELSSRQEASIEDAFAYARQAMRAE